MRDNEDYQLRPQWFFSSPDVDRYLSRVVGKWDAGLIGLRLEAFGLSGCNMDSVYRMFLHRPIGVSCFPSILGHDGAQVVLTMGPL